MNRLLLILLCIVLVLPVGCDLLSGQGNVKLFIETNVKKVISPFGNMTVSLYHITGKGPFSASYDDSAGIEKEYIFIEGLVSGEWEIKVEALNGNGDILGRKQKIISIIRNKTIDTYMTITPVLGNGNLHIEICWDSETVLNPDITAFLVLSQNHDNQCILEPIIHTSGPIQGEITGTEIPAGDHTLVLTLCDGETVIKSLAEIVQIRDGITTNGDYDFTVPGPCFENSITPESKASFNIYLNPAPNFIDKNEFLEITASVLSKNEPVVYIWVIDDVIQSILNPTFTMEEVPLGNHCLMVYAYTTNGKTWGFISLQFELWESFIPDTIFHEGGNPYGSTSGSYTPGLETARVFCQSDSASLEFLMAGGEQFYRVSYTIEIELNGGGSFTTPGGTGTAMNTPTFYSYIWQTGNCELSGNGSPVGGGVLLTDLQFFRQ